MVSKKDLYKELLMYGSESENNKREAIEVASFVIAVLNSRTANKKLTSEELEKIDAGGWHGMGWLMANEFST